MLSGTGSAVVDEVELAVKTSDVTLDSCQSAAPDSEMDRTHTAYVFSGPMLRLGQPAQWSKPAKHISLMQNIRHKPHV